MLGAEISSFIKDIPALYCVYSGIFTEENIPTKLKDKHFIILNKNSSHWYGIFRNGPGLIEVFDSLGCSEDKVPDNL